MIYQCFKQLRHNEETDFLKVYRFCLEGVNYKIGVTKKRANKRTRIVCENNCVKLIQRLLLKPAPFVEKTVTNTSAFFEPYTVHIIVVSGKSGQIAGLDDGEFFSAVRFEKRYDKLFVMSKKAFKNLKD